LSLVSAPILIHHLGVEGFGRYTTVIALVALIGVGTEAGLNAIALREYSVQEAGVRTQVMRHLLGIRLAVTGLGMLGAVAFAAAAVAARVGPAAARHAALRGRDRGLRGVLPRRDHRHVAARERAGDRLLRDLVPRHRGGDHAAGDRGDRRVPDPVAGGPRRP